MANSDPPRMTGLFAGILSAANGTWIPMPELRRMSSVAAWMLCFGSTTYLILRIAEKSSALSKVGPGHLLLLLLVLAVFALITFCLFLRIGCRQIGYEPTSDDRSHKLRLEGK